MKVSHVCAAALAASAVTLFASMASAQADAPTTGPALPGICVLSKERMIVTSVVGKWVAGRLQQLKAQVDAELNSEGSTLDADVKALEAQRGSLPADQFEQKGNLINQRAAVLQRKAQQRQAELGKTQEKAVTRIFTEADPIVRSVIVQRKCSVVLDGATVLASAPAMDLTDSVVHGLDTKIQQFPFDREHLDQPGAAGQ
jgi:outer membrane protein